MRIVKYFFRSFLLVIIIGLLWGKSSHAQTSSWTDSLRVSIVDSTVLSLLGEDYLEFKIVVERINENWNTSSNVDTVLGNSDLYFHANFVAFDPNALPKFVYVHDSLFVSNTAAYGNPNAILQATVEKWAGRLHIALTRRDQGNLLLGVSANSSARYKLRLAVGKPDTLCTVQWKLAASHAVQTQIRWDKRATGLQTYGGNPIIDSLTGNIEKLPADSLDVDCMPGKIYACEGGEVAIGMHAESTGRGPIFEWYDSIPGGGQAYPVLASVTTQDRTAGGKRYTYDYRFNTVGDTLYIDKVPNSIDSIYFYCVVSDTTLTKSPKKYCETRLFVRDSIKGFVSPLNSIYTLNKIDTVTICSGDSTVAVRFNFFGISANEESDIDSVYMIYRNDPCDGGVLAEDTVGINMSEVTSEATIDGMDVLYKEIPIKVKRGKVYIQKIGTYYCDNAAVAVEYDTIFIKEDNSQMLPRVTVAPTKSVKIDSVPSTIFQSGVSYGSLGLSSLRGLGSLNKGSFQRLPFSYTAKDTVGLDTVLYTGIPGRKCVYMREVEVQDLKYLTLKVYLWGAWKSNAMYAFMGEETDVIKYTNMLDFVGANYKSPDSTFLIPTNRLRQLVRERSIQGDTKFVDWIKVSLVEATLDGPTSKPLRVDGVINSLWGFVRTDGIVCDTAGNPYLGFRNLSKNGYYVVITHRNHIGIISNAKITLSPTKGGTFADFTLTEPCIVAGEPKTNFLKNGNTIFMLPGDVDGNGLISVADRSLITKKLNPLLNYYIEDIDFNRTVTNTDRSLLSKQKNGAQEAFSGWVH